MIATYKGKKIFKVATYYKRIHTCNGWIFSTTSSHWVLARDKDDALKIANKHKIGNPMGRNARKRRVRVPSPPATWTRRVLQSKGYKGSLWEDVDGKLVQHKPPIQVEIHAPTSP